MSLLAYGFIFTLTFMFFWSLFNRFHPIPAQEIEEEVDDQVVDPRKKELFEATEDVHLRIPAYIRDTKRFVALAQTGVVNDRFPSMFEIRNIGKVNHHLNK